MSPLACPADTSISGTAAKRRTPLLHQLGDGLAERRRSAGAMKPPRRRALGVAAPQLLYEVAERLGSGLVPGAMAGDEQGGRRGRPR